MPDVNLHSYNGPGDNHNTVANRWEYLDGTGYADTLKFSTGLENFKGTFGTVISGSEDAVDINNKCRGIELAADRWMLRGRMGFTIKGGSKDVGISGWVEGHGSECDVDIGNWSDQSHEPVTGVRLNLRMWDGSAVRVRVINGEFPTFVPGSGPYRYVFPWPWLPGRKWVIKAFHQLRRVGLFR